MTIAQDMGIKVEKRPMKITELSNLKEAGCCGTAAVITPVRSITYRDRVYSYGDGETVGPISGELYKRLTDIQNGLAEDKYEWTRKIPLD